MMIQIILATILFALPSFALFKGQQASPENWPQAAVFFLGKNSQSDFKEKCSSVVLDSRHLLTAAHCFRTGEKVRKIHLSQGLQGRESEVTVERVVVHPNYDRAYAKKPNIKSSSLNFDLALIVLKKPLSEKFQGIAGLLSRESMAEAIQKNQKFWLVAFGDFNKRVTQKENHYMRQVEVDVRFDLAQRPFLKAYSKGPGKFCHGDSGSGLVTVDKGGKIFLAGIQSAAAVGSGCDVNPSTGFFALTADSLSWIEQQRSN